MLLQSDKCRQMRDHFRSLGLAKLYHNRGVGKGNRKQEFIHAANGNVNQYNHLETYLVIPYWLKIPLVYDPVIPLLGIYIYRHKEICITVYCKIALMKTRYLIMCVLATQSLSLTLCDPMDYSLPGSSVHGILQIRILEWVAYPFYRGSSQPRDQTQVSHIAGGFFTV